jgi:hypothetical protein
MPQHGPIIEFIDRHIAYVSDAASLGLINILLEIIKIVYQAGDDKLFRFQQEETWSELNQSVYTLKLSASTTFHIEGSGTVRPTSQ